MPAFLAGALGVQLIEALSMTTVGLGVLVAVARSSAAVSMVVVGPMVDRLGAKFAVRLSMLITAASAAGIALAARSVWSFSLWLLLAGTAVGFGQPAANRLLMYSVPSTRQGVALGVKQSALPVATMLGGISVPVVALTVGWRWVYVIIAATSLLVVLGIGATTRRQRDWSLRRSPPLRRQHRVSHYQLALVFGLSHLASSTIIVFFTGGAVAAGLGPARAGSYLAIASGAAVVTRLLSGVVIDRVRVDPFHFAAGLLLMGCAGLAVLAFKPDLVLAGVMLGLAGTWGFPAVFWFGVLRSFPDRPGDVTGIVAPGGHLGGAVGPPIMGAVIQVGSFRAAWVIAGSMALLSAGGMVHLRRRLAD